MKMSIPFPADFRLAQHGVGLIEILVAIVLFSLGILGMMRMQLGAVQASADAAWHTTALNLASSWIEEMRTFAPLLQVQTSACTTAGGSTACDLALAAWQKRVQASLPAGQAIVTRSLDEGALVQVQVQWAEQRGWLSTATSGAAVRTVQLGSRLF